MTDAAAATDTPAARPLLGLAAAMLLTAMIGSLYAFSIFLEPLQQRFAVSRAEASGIFSVATVCFAASMLLAPPYFRLVSPALVGLATGVIAAAGLAIAAAAHSIALVALGYGGVFGVANGIGYAAALQVVNSGFRTRTGLATGAVVASYAMGAVVLAPAFRFGVGALGAQGTFLAMASALLVAAVLIAVLLMASGIRWGSASAAAPASSSVSRRVFWLLWAGFATGAAAGLMAISQAAAIVAAYGGDAAAIVLGTSAIALANGLGRIASGWLSDRADVRQILALVPLAALAGFVALLLLGTAGVAVAVLAIAGAAYGALASAYPVAVARHFGAAQVSRIYGRVFTAWGLAGLCAPLIAGRLFDATGGYGWALVAASAAALLSSAAGYALPRSKS